MLKIKNIVCQTSSHIDEKTFRATMGQFPTGVTVVTTRHPDQGIFGVTISSLTSLSLDPPLVLFCLSARGHSINIFREIDYFVVNLLAHDQSHLSTLFASRTPIDWDHVDVTEHDRGCPLLSGALGHIICEKHTSYPGGDHDIIIGRVLEMATVAETAPLIRYAGKYGTVSV